MKKRILSLLLVFLILFNMIPMHGTLAVENEQAVTVRYLNTESGESETASAVPLYRGGELYLTACLRDDVAGKPQWQIEAEPNTWVNIQGGTATELRVSYGMVQSLLKNNTVRMRCAVFTADDTFYSEPTVISVTETAPLAAVSIFRATRAVLAAEPLSATATPNTATDEDITIYTVTIEYVYAEDSKFSGQRVALPYIAEVADGNTLNETVISPNCVGYAPNIASIDLSALGKITENHAYTVKYSPEEVSYTVRHYQQNANDDEYTWVGTTVAVGKTEALTSDSAANTYVGFTALSHYHEEIAADSSTLIDIYYDRNYYLMSFNLDGGYGTEPIYARYGAEINVKAPYKPGYTFSGWSGTVPAVMPATNQTYTAQWAANSGIAYTVAYWLEDPNTANTYNFWASAQKFGEAGSTVQGASFYDYTQHLDSTALTAMDTYEKQYSYYSHADTDVVIEGDGSTVVNVYYKRNEYTLKFYYAMSSGSGTSAAYYVIGGSTYRFGASATISNTASEVALLDHYMGSYTSERGVVDELPTLNTKGAARNYATGSDTSTVSGTQYQYHYISFTAKYGADISALWPCDVFNSVTRLNTDEDIKNTAWSGSEAFVSAWNGEHHVYYSQHNGNQTIKGNYNELDYKLLFDSDFTDSATVAYLCFWENGADIGWSIPELYRYNIYVPVLSGQNTENLITKVYNGVTYYLHASYDTVDDSSYANQTPPAMNGFAYSNRYTYETLHKVSSANQIIYNQTDNPILYDAQGTLVYSEAYAVNFFYQREINELKFVNGTNESAQDVVFGADISAKAPTLTYFDASLAHLYTFNGWYTTSNAIPGTGFTLSNATMPDSPLTLYAKWDLISHNVRIYLTEDAAENGTEQIGSVISVTHDQPVPESARPDPSALQNGDDTFIGWFYRDENGTENAFDFATMTITRNMTVYAKWRSNAMKQVEVYYIIEDENGNRTQIADTETLMLRVGQTRTFEAKTGNSLYEQYRIGCFPTTSSHSITPQASDMTNDAPLTYTFVYKQYASVPYNVEYYVQQPNGTLRPAFKDINGKAAFVSVSDYANNSDYTAYVEEHADNDKAIVTELYIPNDLVDPTWTLPNDYIPNALKLQQIIVPGENNVYNDANTVRFIYTYEEGAQVALYSVNHYIQSPNAADQYELYGYKEYFGTVGNTVQDASVSIPGYTYNHTITNANKQPGNTLTETDGVGTMYGTVVSSDSLELNFYYTVNTYPYQVMYLEQNTNRVLLAAKTTDANGALLVGRYGAKVTEQAAVIDGYNADAAEKTAYIQMEADNTASVNTIVFYYTRKSADLIISKTVALDEEQAAEEGISELPAAALTQKFTFTVTCPTGFHKSVYDYTVTNADNTFTTGKITAGTTTMTFSLAHGQRIAIHDLAMGNYTVTETYVPGFRTSVDGTIRQAYPVTLQNANQSVAVDFLNAFPFYTGDLVVRKAVTKLDTSDPAATKPYKVTVVLTPDNAAREVDRVISWTDGDGTARSFTVPALTGENDTFSFTFDILVPVNGEVKLEGTPVGGFTVTEMTDGIGYITDYYKVTYNKAVHQNDEVSGTNHTVNGVVHGGHPTAVSFLNTYKKGTLTINKTVLQEYAKDNWQRDTFTFAIVGTTELPDGEYTVSGAQVTVTNGIVTVKDASGNDPSLTLSTAASSGSLTFANLPAGYYTVTESAALGADKYTATPAAGKYTDLLVNDTAVPTAASFTNTYNRTTGNLQVGKQIVIVTEGSIIDTDQAFNFEITLKDKALSGSFACTVMSANGTTDPADDTPAANSISSLTATDSGKLRFALKHDQYILIQALPVGDYLVKELAIEGYDSSFGDVSESAGNYSVDPAVVTTDTTTVLNCQNAYPVYYANLIVRKDVVTPADHSAADRAPADDVFTFTVTIGNYSDKLDLSNGIAAKFYDSATDTTPTEHTLYIINDVLTFTLRHDEWVDLNLPVCTYTIAETALASTVNPNGTLTDHYTVSYTVGNAAGASGASYTLVSGERENVTFTNTYKRHYADLTIETVCADSNQSFVFDVTAQNTAAGDLHLQIILVGTDARTIRDLPIGTYTVTEQDDWSWREGPVSGKTAVLRAQNETVVFDFAATDRIHWLSGFGYRLKGGA